MPSSRSFRVLSVSGGGARGIFQAVFLQKLSQRLGIESLYRHFDLIAGTSTGALVALAVALDIDLTKVVASYHEHSASIFRPRRLWRVRRGARYDAAPLRAALNSILGDARLADCKVPVVVTATSLQTHEHRVFSTVEGRDSPDGQLSAAEVAMASSAAPTFFPPARIGDDTRSYMDGGLWANAPAVPALLRAHHRFRIPFERMALLSLNNGRRSAAPTHGEFSRMRPWSVTTAATLVELVFGSQMSAAHDLSAMLLGQEGVMHVDVALAEEIALDNAARSNECLPPLAEGEASRLAELFARMFLDAEPRVWPPATDPIATLLPIDLIRAAGLTKFYPSRAHYHTHRAEGGSIDRYVSSAQRSVTMISIHLMTGVAFHDLLGALRSKIVQGEGRFGATISLLDPEQEDVLTVMARNLGDRPDELALRIRSSLRALSALRLDLPSERREALRLRVHRAMPFGSAIMLDPGESGGRIQVETKPYQAPFDKSVAFEITNFGDNDLFGTLLESYERLMADGRPIGENEY